MVSGFGDIRLEIAGTATSEIRGTIANISHGAIHVKVPQFLDTKSVRVWFSENCHLDGQLLFCRAEDGKYRAGIYFPPDHHHNKRSELRVPLPDVPALVFQFEGATLKKCEAKAVDISRSGLG